MSLTLYDYELSAAAYKVRLLLALLRLPYTKRAVDVFPGSENRSPTFLALNPRGTVPVLVDDDLTMSGADAILCHLAARHDPAGTWLPRDAALGPVMSWLFFAAEDLAAVEAARLEAMLRISAPIVDAKAKARAALALVEDHMVLQGFRDVPFLAGPQPTVADLAVFPAAALAGDVGFWLEDCPALRGWMRRIRALPGFVTMPGIPDYL